MIPKNKIEEAAELYTGLSLKLLVPEAKITNTAKDLYNYAIFDFTDGVEFAEKELENLAIEFAEWINWCGWTKLLITDSQNWLHITGDVKTTKELFEIFKKEKYETNK